MRQSLWLLSSSAFLGGVAVAAVWEGGTVHMFTDFHDIFTNIITDSHTLTTSSQMSPFGDICEFVVKVREFVVTFVKVR